MESSPLPDPGPYFQKTYLFFLPVQVLNTQLFEQASLTIIIQPLSFNVMVAIVVMALLIFCSALISGSEIAFFSLSSEKLGPPNGKNRSKSNAAILKLLNKPKKLLATILIANNFINVSIVVIGSYITLSLFNFSDHPIMGFVVEVIVITFLILLLGEVIPKVYATQNSLKFAKFMSFPIAFLDKLFVPLSRILVSSTNLIDKRIQSKKHDVSVEDLSHVIEITNDNETTEAEKEMLKGIVNLGTTQVKQIMKSRVDVTAFDITTGYHDLLNEVKRLGYSRIPVYEENFDKVKGILYIKDLLMHMKKEDDFNWQGLIRTPYFIPENKKIDDLLKDFQDKKIHMAIAVDEYGGTSGIVTLEDVLEEIVGEITDEFDHDLPIYKKIDENTYIFEGRTLLNDVIKLIELDNHEFDEIKGDSDSLGGLLLELAGKIPKLHEKISYKNFDFKIEAVDKRRIKKVRISIQPKDG